MPWSWWGLWCIRTNFLVETAVLKSAPALKSTVSNENSCRRISASSVRRLLDASVTGHLSYMASRHHCGFAAHVPCPVWNNFSCDCILCRRLKLNCYWSNMSAWRAQNAHLQIVLTLRNFLYRLDCLQGSWYWTYHDHQWLESVVSLSLATYCGAIRSAAPASSGSVWHYRTRLPAPEVGPVYTPFYDLTDTACPSVIIDWQELNYLIRLSEVR